LVKIYFKNSNELKIVQTISKTHNKMAKLYSKTEHITIKANSMHR